MDFLHITGQHIVNAVALLAFCTGIADGAVALFHKLFGGQ